MKSKGRVVRAWPWLKAKAAGLDRWDEWEARKEFKEFDGRLLQPYHSKFGVSSLQNERWSAPWGRRQMLETVTHRRCLWLASDSWRRGTTGAFWSGTLPKIPRRVLQMSSPNI